ncbi:MAG: precorrin-2 C(20)-methyltransferase [Armatimonadetes bacterium]|nr:precorrin-2 C(20)-methyltransferase [Armatimonadota bacterium]
MKTLYGLGVGPGDPELLTLKAASILSRCRRIFAPRGDHSETSVALAIAGAHLHPEALVEELVFPMTRDSEVLSRSWGEAAHQVAGALSQENACFLTLGDPLLYSTFIYLARAVREILPEAQVVTVPGITSFSAAAALTGFPLGEAKHPLVVIPTCDDLEPIRKALGMKGTVVLMKIGRRLESILKLLEEEGLLDRGAFVARAGQDGQRIETDLRKLRGDSERAGYLSIILVEARP